MRNSSNLITVVGILLILFGIARAVVALASGNPEHMALGTVVGIAYGTMGSIALWVECRIPESAPVSPRNERSTP